MTDLIKTFDFYRLFEGTIYISEQNVEFHHYAYQKRGGQCKNKTAFILDGHITPWDYLAKYRRSKSWQRERTGRKLFIDPEVAVPRDLFRNSGYQIVRSADKADMIVLSKYPEKYREFVLTGDIIATKEDNLYCYTVNYPQRAYCNSPVHLSRTIIKRITKKLEEWGMTVSVAKPDLNVYIAPKNEWRTAALRDDPLSEKMIDYRSLSIIPSTTVTPEALCLWSMMDDSNMCAVSILQSNWREYPLTISYLLKNYQPSIIYDNSSAVQNMIDDLGISRWSSLCRDFLGKSILPHDWNMLQKFIFMKIGVQEEQGWAPSSDDLNLASGFIFSKYAVKQKLISHPERIENLISMLD